MAEEKKKSPAWVIQQAQREVDDAQERLKNATSTVTKRQAKSDLDKAKARLAELRQTSRRARKASDAVDTAQAAVDAAAKTPGTEDDEAARKQLADATQKSERAGEAKQAARDEAREVFYAAMGPQIAEAIKKFPQLRDFFQQAIAEQWNSAKMERELSNPANPWSEWWKAKSPYWKAGYAAQFGAGVTPGDWQSKIDTALEAIDAAALEKGVVLTEKERQNLARRYWYSEWSSDNDALMSWMQQRRATKEQQGTNVPEDPEAEIDPLLPANRNAKISQLRDLAEAYGLEFDDAVLGDWADLILDNKKNVNGIQDTRFKEFLVQESRSKYVTFGDQLDADTNLRQLAGGYVSELARLLELDPASVRFTPSGMDPLLQKALTNIDPETGKPSRIPLWEFTKQIRLDDRWQFTDNARDTYMGAASKFAKSLGLAG